MAFSTSVRVAIKLTLLFLKISKSPKSYPYANVGMYPSNVRVMVFLASTSEITMFKGVLNSHIEV
jgi:hypothetical protein